jgi:hypothetical protein
MSGRHTHGGELAGDPAVGVSLGVSARTLWILQDAVGAVPPEQTR